MVRHLWIEPECSDCGSSIPGLDAVARRTVAIPDR